MPIYVTKEEYEREKRHIDWLYYRIRLDNTNIKRWEANLKATERWARRLKKYPDTYEKYAKPELERVKKRLEYWKEQKEIHINTLKRELERFRQKVIVKKIKYEYARITKDVRVYAKEKKKRQTPDPVCEVSARLELKLPHPMTNEEIELWAETQNFEDELEEDINEILFCASFKAGRSHKKWRQAVYKEQQFEAKGIDEDEVEHLNEKIYWLKFYRPETVYDHEEIISWIREVRKHYQGKPVMLRHIRQSSLEEWM